MKAKSGVKLVLCAYYDSLLNLLRVLDTTASLLPVLCLPAVAIETSEKDRHWLLCRCVCVWEKCVFTCGLCVTVTEPDFKEGCWAMSNEQSVYSHSSVQWMGKPAAGHIWRRVSPLSNRTLSFSHWLQVTMTGSPSAVWHFQNTAKDIQPKKIQFQLLNVCIPGKCLTLFWKYVAQFFLVKQILTN